MAVHNPFIFGKIVQGEQFINREEEVKTISRTLSGGQNVICYSPRRYGKTSMMIKVKEKLEAVEGYVYKQKQAVLQFRKAF